jgi:hypothetical protein
MTLVELLVNPATTSAIGAACGGFASGLVVVRRKMRSIARAAAHDAVEAHEETCRFRGFPALTPAQGYPVFVPPPSK